MILDKNVHLVFWYNRRLQTTFRNIDVPEEQGSDDQVLSLFILYKCCKHIMYIKKHTPLMTYCVFFHCKIFLMFLPNTNQNCVSISVKVVRRRFQVRPPKSNKKPVFCISSLITQRQKIMCIFF